MLPVSKSSFKTFTFSRANCIFQPQSEKKTGSFWEKRISKRALGSNPSHFVFSVLFVLILLSSATDAPPGRLTTLSVYVLSPRALWHLSEWSVFLRGAIFEQVMFKSIRGDKQEARLLFSHSVSGMMWSNCCFSIQPVDCTSSSQMKARKSCCTCVVYSC